MTNLLLAPPGTANTYTAKRLTIAPGDVISLSADTSTDGAHLLRVLATLDRPAEGEYRFKGAIRDPRDYRQCLGVKRQIGYVSADTAMISNRTIRENLLLTRFYVENDLSIDIDETTSDLLRSAGLLSKLDRRPAALSDAELLRVVSIREMGKTPLVMLIERPEHIMQISPDDAIFDHLKKRVESGMTVVFISHHREMTALANRHLTLADKSIQTCSAKVPSTGSTPQAHR